MDLNDVRANVKALLTSKEWLEALRVPKSNDASKERPNLKNLQTLLKKAKLPPLVLVDADTLEKGPIPRSDQSNKLTSGEKVDVANSFVFFVSHRWFGVGPNATPDDKDNSKARSLFNFAKWFEVYWHGKNRGRARKIYFWMDYFGIDQLDATKRAHGISAIPLYVSACGGTIECMANVDQYHNHGYYTRAWCLLEAALAFKFQLAGAAPFILPFTWRFKEMDEAQYNILKVKTEDGIGVVKKFAARYVKKQNTALGNPVGAELSNEDDKKYIEHLLDLATTVKGLEFKGRQQSTVLAFGDTEVEARVMIDPSDV